MQWSENIKNPPTPMARNFDPRDRAYPFEDSNLKAGVDWPIEVYPDHVVFRGQRGPIKEVGINGCQIDDLIVFTAKTIKAFNEEFPCEENDDALMHLERAWNSLDYRRQTREARGVEGKDLA